MPHQTEEEKCAEALADFTDLLIAGREPSIDLFLLEYPDLAARLRPLLETTVTMYDAFEVLRRRSDEKGGLERN